VRFRERWIELQRAFVPADRPTNLVHPVNLLDVAAVEEQLRILTLRERGVERTLGRTEALLVSASLH
jgi:acetylglutamate synthase